MKGKVKFIKNDFGFIHQVELTTEDEVKYDQEFIGKELYFKNDDKSFKVGQTVWFSGRENRKRKSFEVVGGVHTTPVTLIIQYNSDNYKMVSDEGRIRVCIIDNREGDSNYANRSYFRFDETYDMTLSVNMKRFWDDMNFLIEKLYVTKSQVISWLKKLEIEVITRRTLQAEAEWLIVDMKKIQKKLLEEMDPSKIITFKNEDASFHEFGDRFDGLTADYNHKEFGVAQKLFFFNIFDTYMFWYDVSKKSIVPDYIVLWNDEIWGMKYSGESSSDWRDGYNQAVKHIPATVTENIQITEGYWGV